MKIVPIFEPYLYAFQYENEESDEFSRLLDDWTNFVFLEEFFANNAELLVYEKIKMVDAIAKTTEMADKIYKLFEDNQENLNELFENLTPSTNFKNLDKQKYKKKWLRLYAIMLESGYYVITGGAIKQSQEMDKNPLTKEELRKLEKCKNFLKTLGVTDVETFLELKF